MRINDPKIAARLGELGVELVPGTRLADLTSLGIGGTTDLLRIRKHESIPDLLTLLDANHVPHKFLGGGSNLLVGDDELPWVVLQLVPPEPDVILEGNFARVDAAADLGRTVTFCAMHDLGGMEGLIGVPGTVGGALRMNAGAYGMQIGAYVREVKLYRAADHPYKEILQGIRICNEKRRSSQPLGQKSAGCIFKNPPGASAGRMIDDLGLKGLSVGDARVSDRHANFFVNAGKASARDMLKLIADVRERVKKAYGVTLENEVVVWNG